MEDDSAVYLCPRCGGEVSERFYGPCTGCREALVVSQRSQPAEGAAMGPGGTGSGAKSRFEPKANVVPNHVATRE